MQSNSFQKKYRLLSKNDFSYIRKNSKIRQNRWMRVYFKPINPDAKPNDSQSRIGIAVSKKVGNACVRALIKRTIRESFRMSGLKNEGLDFVVTVSPLLMKRNEKSEAIKVLRIGFLSILAQLSVVQS